MHENRISGKKARANGAVFEQIFERRAKSQGWVFIRFPLGCRRVGRNTLLQIKTPLDCILVKDGRAIFVDLKSTGINNFSHSMVTPHQVEVLKAIECEHLSSGYIVWFRESDEVVFFGAGALDRLKVRESLSVEDGITLGSIADFKLSEIFDKLAQLEIQLQKQ